MDGGGERPWIRRVGDIFGCGEVHRSALGILDNQHIYKRFVNVLSDRDDEAVWKRMHPERRMFGVGSFDSPFVLNGRYLSFYGCSSYVDARHSQEVYSARMEFEKERMAQVKLKNRLEQLEKDQEEERKQSRIELEKERAKREKLQKRMNDVIIG